MQVCVYTQKRPSEYESFTLQVQSVSLYKQEMKAKADKLP